MKATARKLAEIAFVERTLGDSVICSKCSATLATFADACTADLCEMCPGFMAIENTKTDFAGKRLDAELRD